jgi:hypothetical protein
MSSARAFAALVAASLLSLPAFVSAEEPQPAEESATDAADAPAEKAGKADETKASDEDDTAEKPTEGESAEESGEEKPETGASEEATTPAEAAAADTAAKPTETTKPVAKPATDPTKPAKQTKAASTKKQQTPAQTAPPPQEFDLGEWQAARRKAYREREDLWWFWSPYAATPGYAPITVGAGVAMPLLGWNKPRPGLAVHLRNKAFEAGFSSFRDTDPDTGEETGYARLWAGYNNPLAFWQIGERFWGISGWMIAPIYSLGAGVSNFGFSFHGGAGLTLQIPFAIADIRLMAEVPLGNDGLETAFQREQQGFGLYPQATFELDGLYELLDPELKSIGTIETRGRWQSHGGVATWKDGTSTGAYEDDMGAFGGLLLQTGIPDFDNPERIQLGAGWGGRLSVLGLDFYARYTNFPFEERPANADDTPEQRKLRVRGTTDALEFGGDLNVALLSILMDWFTSGSGSAGVTQYSRFNGYLAIHYATPLGVTVDNPDVLTLTDSPEPDRYSAWGVETGIGYEWGPIVVRYMTGLNKGLLGEVKNAAQDAQPTRTMLEVMYIVPIWRILNAREDLAKGTD